MKKLVVRSFCLVFVLGGAACKPGGPPAAAPNAKTTATNPTAAVAKINGQVVTEAELQTAAKVPVGKIEAELAEKLYLARKGALDELIDKRLLDAAAKAAGTTPEKLIETEVTSKISDPPDAEVQTVYDRTKASGRPLPEFAQVKPDIVKFLKEQKVGQARQTYFEKLRTAAKVEMLLPPLLPPKVEVAAVGPSKGPDSARITIVEFSDFECPFCSRVEETVKKVMDTYKGQIRLVYREFPLPFHAQAPKASEAALCAGDQGKYWEMHERLFANQQGLAVPALKEHAKGLGVDMGKFEKCLDGGDKAKVVDESKKAGEALGVTGTPAFFINGRLLSGAQPFEKFKELIDYELSHS